MRVMIYEPDHVGHRLTYLRLLLPALLELDVEVVAVLGRTVFDTPEYQAQLAWLKGKVQMEALVPPLPPHRPLEHATSKLAALRQAVKNLRPQRVYLPTADGITQLAGIARLAGKRYVSPHIPVEALLFQGRAGYPQHTLRDRIRTTASLAATTLAPWSRMFYLDPIGFEGIQRRGGSLAQRSRLMPDPVESHHYNDRATARRNLNIPEHGRYIGCAGYMDSRKGIDLLIAAFAQAQLGDDDRLLLAGQVDPGFRPLIEGAFAPLIRSGRMISIDRYLTEAELHDAFAALDVVCAPYPLHTASASNVIRAANADRPSLVSKRGWTGLIVPRFNLGWTVDVQDLGAFAAAIKHSLDNASGFALGEGARRFIAFHRPENFCAAWTADLRQCLGLAPADGTRSWSWVLEPAGPSPGR